MSPPKKFFFTLLFCSPLLSCSTNPLNTNAHPFRTLGSSPSSNLSSEQALPADSLADSIGLNTRFDQYTNGYETLAPLLGELGVRHIRDGVMGSPADNYYPIINALFKRYSIRNIGLIGNPSPCIWNGDTYDCASAVSTLVSEFPHLEAIEPPNEYDCVDPTQDPNWANTLQMLQPAIYRAVKRNPITKNIPVLGPSLCDQTHASQLGNLSEYLDAGNMHNYNGSRNPETGGWGGMFGCYDGQTADYGSFDFNVCNEKYISIHKPIWSTEIGDPLVPSPDSTHPGINYKTGAKYAPRLFAYQLKRGIPRTYYFQLIDGAVDFYYYGIVDQQFHKKPSFYAIKNLIAATQDPGHTHFSAGKLNYSWIGGAEIPSNLQTLLLQKHDGSWQLLVWLGTQSEDPNTFVETPAEPVRLTLTLANSPKMAQTSVFQADGSLKKAPLKFAGGSTDITVTDYVTIIDIQP